MTDIIVPEYTSDSLHMLGKDFLLFVATGATLEPSPTWTLIGGQKSSSFNMQAEEIDVSDKTSGSWGATDAGVKSWSIDLEGMSVLNNTGAEVLEQQFLVGKPVYVMLWHKSGKAYKGWASISEFSLEASQDDAATTSGALKGLGAPEITKNEPDPLTP